MMCLAPTADEMLFAWLDAPRPPIETRTITPVRVSIPAAAPRKALAAPIARIDIEEDAERWDGLA